MPVPVPVPEWPKSAGVLLQVAESCKILAQLLYMEVGEQETTRLAQEALPIAARDVRANGRLMHNCKAEGADVLDNKEQGYRRLLARKLRDDRRAGTQPSTPTPGQRYRDTAQVEFEERDYDPESDLGSGNDPVDPNSANEEECGAIVGSGCEDLVSDRTVSFSFFNDLDTRSESKYFSPYCEQVIVDVGSVEGEAHEWPFKIKLVLSQRNQQEERDVWGTVDGGAMLCVLDSTVWAQVEHSFDRLRQSKIVCRMANGTCVPSIGTGTASVQYKQALWPIRFEVIDSRGAFELLLGKDWLRTASALQVFESDSLSLLTPTGRVVLDNENPCAPRRIELPDATGQSKHTKTTTAERPTETIPEPAASPTMSKRQDSPGEFVPHQSSRLRSQAEARDAHWVGEALLLEAAEIEVLDTEVEVPSESPETLWRAARVESEEETLRGVMMVEEAEERNHNDALTEILDRSERNRARQAGPADIMLNENLEGTHPSRPIAKPPVPKSDRLVDPFKPECVANILKRIRIGDKLTDVQKSKVENLVREYADVFALNLSEVLPVDFTQMKLDIPEGATFPKRVGQKKLTKPQRQALYSMLDKLEEAKIIERVNQDQVAAVSPINMVPKPGGSERPSLKILQQMANSECRKYGIPVEYPKAGFYEEDAKRHPSKPAKWRLVQNFAAVNKVTQIRPFPMGDMNAKQQAVAGHKFVSVMDLQAGFHAIPIAPKSVPYTGFYVEGRGHYVYLCMPFGLTGAPTVFCEMVAEAFHDLLGKGLEVWMDDMATASNDFESHIGSL
ncbi:Retrovirus-related Pol polyprotein from transposon opus [Ceratobasidium sp. AG-Ba]|nr:Retrovirus-related Pol polyprotein from transposon opus [Ceratobasidium sp. AG-Ba]